MYGIFYRLLKIIMIGSTLFLGQMSHAQSIIKPEPLTATTYTVKPDYRKCAFPMCGGWFLTPVNQYSSQLETENEAYQNSLIQPNSVYVAFINYKRLGLTDKQIQELEAAMHTGQALLRGTLSPTPTSHKALRPQTLVVNSAWVGANKTEPVGPYLKVSSSGIMCITTPCPYYKAELINTLFSVNFDDLSFAKAELDREQEAQAWQAVSSTGLIMTGIKYEYQGFAGVGTGVSATKVFFAFPAKP